VQKVVIEKRRVAQQEKVSLQTKFEEEKAQIQQEKEKFLTESSSESKKQSAEHFAL
jgi:hypothetical protein